jgi:hypothetical protein
MERFERRAVEARVAEAMGDPRLSARARVVFFHLAGRDRHGTGRAWPSQATLARDAACSVPVVQRALRELRAAAYIRIARRGLVHGPNGYELLGLTASAGKAPAPRPRCESTPRPRLECSPRKRGESLKFSSLREKNENEHVNVSHASVAPLRQTPDERLARHVCNRLNDWRSLTFWRQHARERPDELRHALEVTVQAVARGGIHAPAAYCAGILNARLAADPPPATAAPPPDNPTERWLRHNAEARAAKLARDAAWAAGLETEAEAEGTTQ